jgi:hypothetical protein
LFVIKRLREKLTNTAQINVSERINIESI